MHKGKLKTLLNKFEEYLIVDHGLAETTVEGYMFLSKFKTAVQGKQQ